MLIRKLGTSWLTGIALLALVSSLSVAQSLAPWTTHVRDVTRDGEAQYIAPLSATQPLRLTLVLPLRNQAALDSLLTQLYDPASPSYRQFLTVDEFTAMFGPSQEDYDAVIEFAASNGLMVVGTSRNRLNVDVTGSVASIEAAFHLNMGMYQHPTENRNFYAPDREPTPDVAVRLWHVGGLDNYSIPHPANLVTSQNVTRNATTGSCPAASFCGSDMRAAYYGGSALTGSGQSLGLLEYYGTELSDLVTYYTNAGQTNNVPVTLVSTDGTSTSCLYPACDDIEQTLDMTQALGMAPGLSSLVVYVGSTDFAIFNAMATAKPLNAQLSSSWSWTPADPTVDDPYFLEFAAQGQNLFQASGDSGAWPKPIAHHHGHPVPNPNSGIYPADDVYVTTVGGTDLTTTGAGGAWSAETAWVDGGGGPSPDLFAIPAWQTTAASGCAACSHTYRNGPDVSANANFTFYVCGDQTACTANLYGGTSFAAPMWAGYMALVNEQAVATSGKPLGFVNPALYALGNGPSYNSDFHDITGGSNGYPATTGYDLATGLGSPNGAALISALAGSPPTPGFSLSASPPSVSVAQGSQGASTVTSTVTGGFNSVISLSATGQPAGVTGGFNPGSITGAGSSTLTFTVAPSTVAGTYPITVKGTAGAATQTTSVSLTVTGTSPDFTVGASPPSLTLARGHSGQVTITTAVSGGFYAPITLTGVAGARRSVTFNPGTLAAPGSGTSTMTVNVSNRASPGSSAITITATGGGVTHTTTVTLTVQ